MRDEKEGRKKPARSNKQGKATQHTQGSMYMYIHVCIHPVYLKMMSLL